MKNIQYYIACIGFLAFSLHTSYAENQAFSPQEENTQPATIEDEIIQKGNRVKLWKMLLKRIVHHESFLTASQNIALKEATEWEAFYLEVLPLFDEEIKRYILAIINKDAILPSLEEVLKNRCSSFDITIILSIPIEENRLQEASIDEIAVPEVQTLEQFLIERALLLAKAADSNPLHENLEDENIEVLESIKEVYEINPDDYIQLTTAPQDDTVNHVEVVTEQPAEVVQVEEIKTEIQLGPYATSSDEATPPIVQPDSKKDQEITDVIESGATATPYIDLSEDEDTTEVTEATTETSPQTEKPGEPEEDDEVITEDTTQTDLPNETSQDITPKTIYDNDSKIIDTQAIQQDSEAVKPFEIKSEYMYYGLIALVALFFLLGIVFFLRRKKK